MNQYNPNSQKKTNKQVQDPKLRIKNLTNIHGSLPNFSPIYRILITRAENNQCVLRNLFNILNQHLQQSIFFCENQDCDIQDYTIEYCDNQDCDNQDCYNQDCDNQDCYNENEDCDIQDYDYEEPINQNKKYFAKIKNQADPKLIQIINEKILQPIRVHINKFTQQDVNQDDIYDETMALIKILNAIKIK